MFRAQASAAPNRPIPPSPGRPPLRIRQSRLESLESTPGEKLRRAGPDAECDAREPRGTERRGLDHVRPLDRDAQHIGLELHQPIVGRGAAVHPERRYREPSGECHRVEQICAAEGHGLEPRTHQVRTSRPAGDPRDGATSFGLPIWRAESHKGRHEMDPAGVAHAAGECLALRRRRDDPETVAQPLHRRTGDEDTPLERVGGLATGAASRGRQHACVRGG